MADNKAENVRYNILLSGKNAAFITDFMQHTELYFKCLSTSDCWQDIVNHFEIFKPDAYVCFVDAGYSKTMNQYNTLKDHRVFNDAPIIVIGDATISQEVGSQYVVDLIIRRPISADNLALRITRFLEERREAEENKRLIAEAARLEEAEKARQAEAEALATEKAKETIARAAAANRKKHVLIVDDDRTVLKMLKTALEDTYDVTTMVNGIMVEKFLEAKNVDVVILDYEMPVETGADIYRKIKANPNANHIPVCFLTGISEREKIMEVMALKPHGYLLKPIDMDMLFATISNLVN
ncbi:MAG: response regulator [Oscillospiraceae bacterium]|nr:response regulator [Oscillospiraceae bacterium]